jgi:hypothetical protein
MTTKKSILQLLWNTRLHYVFDFQRLSHPVPDRMFEKFDLACPVPDGRGSRWGGAGFIQLSWRTVLIQLSWWAVLIQLSWRAVLSKRSQRGVHIQHSY